MVVAGGTVVTLVTKAKKCIRKVGRRLLDQQWSVTLTNQAIFVNEDDYNDDDDDYKNDDDDARLSGSAGRQPFRALHRQARRT